MPSQLHEALLQLFRNRPALAPELLRDALHVELPSHSDVRIESADLTDIQPAEYRADMVAVLAQDAPVLGIVVEVQLSTDERKKFVWPAYVANLRARHRCPVYLLVIAGDDAVARWAAKPIELGGNHRFTPWVIGPAGIPEITNPTVAQLDPELAVLSAIAHGKDVDIDKSVRIASAARLASRGLDAERSKLYFDLTMASLSEAARREFLNMDLSKYEYQSDFAKHYVAQGKALGEASGEARGEARGRIALISRLLTRRFGPPTDTVQSKLSQASIDELDAIFERLLTAQTVEEVIGFESRDPG